MAGVRASKTEGENTSQHLRRRRKKNPKWAVKTEPQWWQPTKVAAFFVLRVPLQVPANASQSGKEAERAKVPIHHPEHRRGSYERVLWAKAARPSHPADNLSSRSDESVTVRQWGRTSANKQRSVTDPELCVCVCFRLVKYQTPVDTDHLPALLK